MLRNIFSPNLSGGQHLPEWHAKSAFKCTPTFIFKPGFEGSAWAGISTILIYGIFFIQIMTFSELVNVISRNALYATIVGTIVATIIISLAVGLWNIITGKSFRKGFSRIFVWIWRILKWLVLKLVWVLRKFVQWIGRLLFNLFKKLLKPLVIEIIREENLQKLPNKSSTPIEAEGNVMIFESEHGDEIYYPVNFELLDKKYEILIEASIGSYWRLGFKLSSRDEFAEVRHTRYFPLVHLSKNEGENVLRIDCYNSKNEQQLRAKEIYPNFFDQVIKIQIEGKSSGLDFAVEVDNRRTFHAKFIDMKYRYARLFAWADGRPYEIKSVIREITA